MINKIREPGNAVTHFIGVILSVLAMILMIHKILITNNDNKLKLYSVVIFGTAMIGLYIASTAYHSVISIRMIKILKKIDHSMIFVLIAGTYTPICLIGLNSKFGEVILILIWVLSIVGIMMKLFMSEIPRIVSTGIYIIMGWLIIIALDPLVLTLSMYGILLLAIGGISYTIGGIIYAKKKPNINNKFGHHELFHCFVILGSTCHFLVVYLYLLQ